MSYKESEDGPVRPGPIDRRAADVVPLAEPQPALEVLRRHTEATQVPLARRVETLLLGTQDILEADCVGLLMLDEQERLRTVASTSDLAARLEQEQERLGLGPGVDATRSATVVVVPDLAVDPRYPSLWQRLSPASLRAVLAAPVMVAGRPAGNLNAVCARPRQWSDTAVRTAAAMASVLGDLLRMEHLEFGRAVPRSGAVDLEGYQDGGW